MEMGFPLRDEYFTVFLLLRLRFEECFVFRLSMAYGHSPLVVALVTLEVYLKKTSYFCKLR